MRQDEEGNGRKRRSRGKGQIHGQGGGTGVKRGKAAREKREGGRRPLLSQWLWRRGAVL